MELTVVREVSLPTIPVKFFVQRGNFRVPANKNLDRPRIESFHRKTSCVSSGLEFPLAKEVGENSSRAMVFQTRKSVDLWGVKR
jgi:hypothetical protein